PGRERSFWAIQSNLPYERPDVPVFTATVRSLTTWSGRQHVGHTVGRPSPWPPASLFAVQGPAGRVHDEGFKHLSLARLAATGVAPPAPSTTLGLNLVRSGRF